jgi:hypothetical protein
VPWVRKQKVLDDTDDYNRQIQKQTLENMTKGQEMGKATKEASEDVASEQPGETIAKEQLEEVADRAERYLATEDTLAARLTEGVSSDYRVLRNQRIGNVDFDFILQATAVGKQDIDIEVKRWQTLASYESNLDTTAAYAAHSSLVYLMTTKRKAKPVIIVVSPRSTIGELGRSEQIRKSLDLPSAAVVVLTIAEEDLASLDVRKLLSSIH